MGPSKLGSLSDKKKEGMRTVVSQWKRTGASVSVLEEGLRLLSEPSRSPARELCRSDSKAAGIACTYGKGSKPKLALSREDAKALLDLLRRIKAAAPDTDSEKKMVEAAASVLLEGKGLSSLTGPEWEPLRRLLSELDPALAQSAFF
jgi:hypothetical protein